jgi:hypothetical protein
VDGGHHDAHDHVTTIAEEDTYYLNRAVLREGYTDRGLFGVTLLVVSYVLDVALAWYIGWMLKTRRIAERRRDTYGGGSVEIDANPKSRPRS